MLGRDAAGCTEQSSEWREAEAWMSACGNGKDRDVQNLQSHLMRAASKSSAAAPVHGRWVPWEHKPTPPPDWCWFVRRRNGRWVGRMMEDWRDIVSRISLSSPPLWCRTCMLIAHKVSRIQTATTVTCGSTGSH